jgi:hypothetical protein
MFLTAFSVGSQAQAPRRKPKPMATPPVRVLTGAEIISQGGDAQDESTDSTPVETPTPKPPSTNTARIKDLNDRVKKLETGQGRTYEEQQKRLLLNLDIITRAEARTESLRKQVFELIEKENTVKARLDQIEYDIRPEVIERILQNGGSLRPEEIRDSRRRVLESERTNLEALLTSIQSNRTNLEASLLRAEQLVDKLRAKLEKDIDDSLAEPPANPEE